MTYRVTFAPAAARQLRTLDPPGRRRIQATIELLASDPRPPAATRLVGGSGEWRVRTGGYRVAYEIDDDILRVLVHASYYRTSNRREPDHAPAAPEASRARARNHMRAAGRVLVENVEAVTVRRTVGEEKVSWSSIAMV